MKILRYAGILGMILFFAASTASQTPDPSQSNPFSSSKLVNAAWKTYNSFVQRDQSSPDRAACVDIPSKYWAEQIKALNPIKVCTHRVNIAIVLRVHDNVEEGKYVCILISSYLPQNGDDGFEFTPNPQKDGKFYSGGPVFDFKRKIGS
jgi:hypothetical protein